MSMVEKLVRALALAAGLRQRPGVLQAICQKRMLEPQQFGPGVEPAQLAGLTQLRTITLNHLQWSQLRQAGQLPTRLAAAELCGYTALADAADWANFLAFHQATAAAPVRTTTIQVRP